MPLTTIDHLELRGKTYYIRMRVPKQFAEVEALGEINRSLKTRDLIEAKARCGNVRHALFMEWRARCAGRTTNTRATFDASIELLKGWGMSFSPMDDLLAGPVDELLARIKTIANIDPASAAVPAAMGAIDLPDISLHDMSNSMPVLKEAEIRAKNARQRREWCGNFKRAARDFTAVVGRRTILTISEQDAADYESYWTKRAKSGSVTANYANKQIRYVRQMIDAHFEDLSMPKSKRLNVFRGMRVLKLAYSPSDNERKKLSLPEKWIRQRLIRDQVLEELDQQASDVAIVSAIGGCRASEIYDLPAEDIHLQHPIPHISFRIVQDGKQRRELKSHSATRVLVLQGPALEAMKRNPTGFSRYRGKAGYSGGVNGFLQDNQLFPIVPEGIDGRYVISGTRHSFEDRMLAARMGNEERAFLMGHSIGRVRGRPVYGSDLDLPIRALLQEMVAIESEEWTPRPIAELWTEIDLLLEEKGYRVR
ncbi:MAG: DUF6538 domain-containing protein [Sulfitobacter sp.]